MRDTDTCLAARLIGKATKPSSNSANTKCKLHTTPAKAFEVAIISPRPAALAASTATPEIRNDPIEVSDSDEAMVDQDISDAESDLSELTAASELEVPVRTRANKRRKLAAPRRGRRAVLIESEDEEDEEDDQTGGFIDVDDDEEEDEFVPEEEEGDEESVYNDDDDDAIPVTSNSNLAVTIDTLNDAMDAIDRRIRDAGGRSGGGRTRRSRFPMTRV